MTVRAIVDFLESRAPAAAAEDWDNPGLLVGSPEDPVSCVAVALDATPATLEAARAAGAQLLVTHHPVIFTPLRQLSRDSVPYRAAAAGIAVLAAHTNLDKAAGGVNDTLAARLGLQAVCPAADGMTRIGLLPAAVSARTLADTAAARLHTAVRVNGDRPVRRIAVCGGSGGSLIPGLIGEADALITGEVRHHEWLAAEAAGLTVLEAGHYATEVPVVETLCTWLRERFPELTVVSCAQEAPYITLGGQ